MEMNETQYPALKSELTLNPKGMAFASKTDAEIATLLNLVGASQEKAVGAGVVEAHAILDCIVVSEWTALTSAQKDRLTFWLSPTKVNTSAPLTRIAVGTIFGVGTQTRANMDAAFDKSIARAEVLFGAGFEVKPWDVERAKALP